MNSACDFCLILNNPAEISKVKETIIDLNPGFQSLTNLLKDLFNQTIEANDICAKCLDNVIKQHTFKERVLKNLNKMNETETAPTQSKVKNYLSKINEPTSVFIDQNNILSIVPASKESLFETQIILHKKFSPCLLLERESIEKLHERLKEECQKIKKVKHEPEGIFGDDDYYVSLQNSNLPSTSTAAAQDIRHEKNEPLKMILKKTHVVKEEIIDEEINEEENYQKVPIEKSSSYANRSLRGNSTGLNENTNYSNHNTQSLDSQEKSLLKDLIYKSKSGSVFKCHLCGKKLKSTIAIKYHVKSRHLNAKRSDELTWVSDRIQEGRRKTENKSFEWQCTECSKIYTSQQALRAHLRLHYKNHF